MFIIKAYVKQSQTIHICYLFYFYIFLLPEISHIRYRLSYHTHKLSGVRSPWDLLMCTSLQLFDSSEDITTWKKKVWLSFWNVLKTRVTLSPYLQEILLLLHALMRHPMASKEETSLLVTKYMRDDLDSSLLFFFIDWLFLIFLLLLCIPDSTRYCLKVFLLTLLLMRLLHASRWPSRKKTKMRKR